MQYDIKIEIYFVKQYQKYFNGKFNKFYHSKGTLGETFLEKHQRKTVK